MSEEKARFLTPWDGRHVSYDGEGRPVFELQSDLGAWSPRFGERWAKKGFRTNLCSTPRWPITFLMFGGLFIAESTMHDKGYTDHEELTREEWDLFFRELMDAPKVVLVQCDPPEWKRNAAYRAVARFGQSSWDAPSTIWQPPQAEIVNPAEFVAP